MPYQIPVERERKQTLYLKSVGCTYKKAGKIETTRCRKKNKISVLDKIIIIFSNKNTINTKYDQDLQQMIMCRGESGNA